MLPFLIWLNLAIQEQDHPVLATINMKGVFFTVLLQESGKEQFAFTWEGEQYTLTQLPHGYWHSATLALYAPAQELAQIVPED